MHADVPEPVDDGLSLDPEGDLAKERGGYFKAGRPGNARAVKPYPLGRDHYIPPYMVAILPVRFRGMRVRKSL